MDNFVDLDGNGDDDDDDMENDDVNDHRINDKDNCIGNYDDKNNDIDI